MRSRTTIAALTMAAAALVPLGGTAHAYHCYSDVVGDCSAVQHWLEDFKQNYKQHVCNLMETATLGVYDCMG